MVAYVYVEFIPLSFEAWFQCVQIVSSFIVMLCHTEHKPGFGGRSINFTILCFHTLAVLSVTRRCPDPGGGRPYMYP